MASQEADGRFMAVVKKRVRAGVYSCALRVRYTQQRRSGAREMIAAAVFHWLFAKANADWRQQILGAILRADANGNAPPAL